MDTLGNKDRQVVLKAFVALRLNLETPEDLWGKVNAIMTLVGKLCDISILQSQQQGRPPRDVLISPQS
jgi:hypothetical protein